MIDTPAAARKANELETVAVALLAAGKEPEGIALLDRVARLRGTPGFRGLLWCAYLNFQGRMAEAEAETRAAFTLFEHPEENPRLKGKSPPYHALHFALLSGGRVREDTALWKGRVGKPVLPSWVAVQFARAKGSADELEPALLLYAREAKEPAWQVDLDGARYFAFAGDKVRSRARVLGVKSSPDWNTSLVELERRAGEAILAWSEGRLEDADRLLAGNLGDASVMDRYFGRQLAGTFHFTSGDCPGAVKSLEEARAVPWPSQPWYRSYFLPLILHRLATCYEKAGDLPKARERNAEMLKRWERADPDLPLLIEAKAMRERLAGATDSASSSR